MYTYIKTVNKYYRKKQKLRKEARKSYQNFPEEEKEKGEKKAWDKCKIFLKKKKKKSVSITVIEIGDS